MLTKLDHRSSASGGLFVAPDLPIPIDSVVDPRIGAHGPALLTFEDGSVFHGVAFGAPVAGGGDLVANTSSTGYQEICTDPSYAGQVVLMTYPLDRQLRAGTRRRPIEAALAARLDRRPRDGSRAGAGASAGRDAARLRAFRQSPGSTRAGSLAVCARQARSACSSARRASWTGTRLSARFERCRAGRTRTSLARYRLPRRTRSGRRTARSLPLSTTA